MSETLKTQTASPESVVPKKPELTPDTRIEDLSTGEINVILEQYEKEFQEPTVEKVERKKGSPEHERSYDLTQSITSGIDYLLAQSKNGAVDFNGITVKKQVGPNNLSDEYRKSGEDITEASTYEVSHALNLGGGVIHTDTARFSVADSHVDVGFFHKQRNTGMNASPTKSLKRGWGGPTWMSDAPPRNRQLRNDTLTEHKAGQRLEWMNKQIAEQVERVREQQSRTFGKKLLHKWIGG